MKTKTESFHIWEYALCIAVTLAILLLCICVGSVNLPISDTLNVLWRFITGTPQATGAQKAASIILDVRLPRVLSAGLVGSALSLCGAAMQGLLRNPLADGSTLGVSAGASVGASLAIAFGLTIPGLGSGGTMIMAMLFAFLSLLLILSLAYRLDYSLATNTIILIGVVFSMFANSIISLIITFSGEKVKSIVFWSMGSLSGSSYTNVLTLLVALLICGGILLRYSQELNAFAIGENNAQHIGINVKHIKLIVLITVSVLIGVCVSIGGSIGFVGLVIPHITRMLTGPNHKRLLPASIFGGMVFLMLADLVARTLLSPLELPIGVVTSLIGAVVFVFIFYSTRKAR